MPGTRWHLRGDDRLLAIPVAGHFQVQEGDVHKNLTIDELARSIGWKLEE